MLLALRDYITKEKHVSLEQLTRAFRVDKTALQPMLSVWILRGVIEEIQGALACGTA